MARRVVASLDDPRLQVNASELHLRVRPNHVVMIHNLVSQHPGKDIVLVCGADAVHNFFADFAGKRDLSGTNQPFQIHYQVHLRSDPKADANVRETLEDDFARFKKSLHPDARKHIGSLEFSRMLDPCPYASSDIRDLIASGGDLFEHLVPPAVAAYIKDHRLYGYRERS